MINFGPDEINRVSYGLLFYIRAKKQEKNSTLPLVSWPAIETWAAGVNPLQGGQVCLKQNAFIVNSLVCKPFHIRLLQKLVALKYEVNVTFKTCWLINVLYLKEANATKDRRANLHPESKALNKQQTRIKYWL